MNNSLNLALKRAARNLSVDSRLVDTVYRSYWGFIKDYISQYHMRTMTEEEFNSIDATFNLPYLGKLFASYDKIRKYNTHLKLLQDAKTKKD